MSSEIIDQFVDKGYKGIVFVGTGLGHTPHHLYDSIKRASEEKMMMVMTVQTIWGFTGMNVYETGRELQNFGVIPGLNMLPETAYAKMCWVLGNYHNSQEARSVMVTNIAGEILDFERFRGFRILQDTE